MFEYVDQTNYTYKVADVNLAEAGRRLLAAAGKTAFDAVRGDYDGLKPLDSVRVTCCLPVDSEGVAFVEALAALGADVRVCANATATTVNELASVLAADEVSTFAWRGESLAEFWWCARKALDFADKAMPEVLFDPDGRLSLLIGKGVEFAADTELYSADYSEAGEDMLELVELLRMVRGRLDWVKLKAGLKLVSTEVTADAIRRLIDSRKA